MKNRLLYIVAMIATGIMAFSICAGAQEKGKVVTLTTAEFKAKVCNIDAEGFKYLGKKPAIVDFYADWCGPCRAIAPTLEELAKEYGDKIVIYKVDVDASGDLAQAFGIRSIPAVLFIPMKGESKMTVGGRSKEDFKKQIDSILLGK
jgi:thioredoxin